MPENLCPICDKPKPAKARGATCGDRKCRGTLAAQSFTPPFPEWEPQWPAISEITQADFSGQEVAFKREWLGNRLVADDYRQSYIGCSAAYTAGVA